MATSSTLRVIHPDIVLRAPESHESRIRRLFRRRARRRRAGAPAVSGWREEATVRGITRMGA
jgi:hypothetical protein